MKKQLLKTMLLFFALIAGSSSVWAADITSPWSHTFSTTDKTFTEDGTVTLSGVDWTLAVTWAGSSKDYNKDATNGMKIGSNSKVPTSMTLSTDGIPGTITKVSVTTGGRSGGTCDVAVKVGTTDFTTTDEWGAATMTNMEFTGESSGAIEISWDQSASSKKGAFYVQKITVVFEEAGSGNKETATWTVTPASATVVAGESTVLDLTTNYDGTLNFVSENEEVATVSYNASTKKITISGVAKGATTINVTGAATETYKAISKTIDVTVTRAIPAGTLFWESVSGYTGSSDVSTELATTYANLDSEDWASFSKVYAGKVLSGDSDGHLKFGSKNDAGTAVTKSIALTGIGKLTYKVQRYDSSNDGNLKITVTGATATGDVDVTGTAAWVEKTVYLTEAKGDVVITFATTNADTRIRVDDILLVEGADVTAEIGAAGYATFSSPYAVDFSETSIEVYTAAVSGDKVILTEVASKKVPANTGVILKGATANANVIEKADALAGNELEISAGTKTSTDAKTVYALAEKGGVVGFYKVKAGVYVPAGKCYIQIAVAGAPDFLGFDDNATGIDEVRGKMEDVRGEFYNLAGQRVAQPTKGLYIVNGKKVIIK